MSYRDMVLAQLGNPYYHPRTRLDDLRAREAERGGPSDRAHVHFHEHAGSVHCHGHNHTQPDYEHAHSTLLDTAAHR